MGIDNLNFSLPGVTIACYALQKYKKIFTIKKVFVLLHLVIGYPLHLAGGGRSCRYQSKALMSYKLDIEALLILIHLSYSERAPFNFINSASFHPFHCTP